jgi:hypothetical protein
MIRVILNQFYLTMSYFDRRDVMNNPAATLFKGGILFLVPGYFLLSYNLVIDANLDFATFMFFTVTGLAISSLGIGYLFSILSNVLDETEISMNYTIVPPFGAFLFAIGFILMYLAVVAQSFLGYYSNVFIDVLVTLLQFGLIVFAGLISNRVSEWLSEKSIAMNSESENFYVE